MGNDLQTVLLLYSAFPCIFRFFGLTSSDTVTTLVQSLLASFLPSLSVVPAFFFNLTFRADGTYTECDLDNSELDEGKWALSNKLLTLRPIDATYALDLNVLEISNSKLVLEYMEKEDDGGVEYAKMTYKRK